MWPDNLISSVEHGSEAALRRPELAGGSTAIAAHPALALLAVASNRGVIMWLALEIALLRFAEWSVWFLIAFAAALHWGLITSDAFVGHRIKLRDALQAWAYTVLCGWFFIIPEWNKLHMIWLALLPFLIAQRLSSHASDRTPRMVAVHRGHE
jgi:hypothetical protein